MSGETSVFDGRCYLHSGAVPTDTLGVLAPLLIALKSIFQTRCQQGEYVNNNETQKTKGLLLC
jgi:hypothetical protein